MNTMTKRLLAVIVTFLPAMAIAYDPSLGPCSSTTNPYNYGDTGPDGGRVVHIEEACSGLEAKLIDAGGTTNLLAIQYTYADGVVAAAAYNVTPITEALLCSTTANPENDYCWHLPDATDLGYLHERKTLFAKNNFRNDFYWSTTNKYTDPILYTVQNLYAGDVRTNDGNLKLWVRAVRQFVSPPS